MKKLSETNNKGSKILGLYCTIKLSYLLVLVLTILNKGTFAQEVPPVQTSASNGDYLKPVFNRFALGLKITHLYDLPYTSYDLLSNGANANDPKGLNGPKTKIDFAAGLDVNYYFSPLFSLDFGYEKGKMTGSNRKEYYISNVNFFSLGANLNLKRGLRTEEYKFIPFLRTSISRGEFEAERRFESDDAIFNKTSGNTLIFGLGMGVKYHLNDKWSLNLMSEFSVAHTDGWDGYDYGSGRDQMLKSSIGLKYSFGKNKHVDRSLAWQDNRVDRLQARMDKQINQAIVGMKDTLNKALTDYMNQPGLKDSDDDGIIDKFDRCPDIAGLFSNNGCPPVDELAKIAKIDSSATKSVESAAQILETKGGGPMSAEEKYRLKNEILVEMYPILFGYNSYQLNEDAYRQLNITAVILRNNPSYNLALTGFTDNVGSADYNKKLANQRANAVSLYLQSRGIDKSRIRVTAIGKDGARDDNGSKVGKANNRRVECKLD
ncbi:MAG: OmpA family protein [Bacteroidia bacterium]|nr:OmpA family protein [Bacteroidia bacterium]MCF8427610.1 OmpA family protein [Bacteroidia bacterium]MCF8447638.1 OmpA family protein [Bacteroidia bacterium]